MWFGKNGTKCRLCSRIFCVTSLFGALMRVAASWRVGALITRLVLSNRLAPTRGTTAGGVAMVLQPARKVVMVPGVADGGARTARRRASRDIFLSTTSLQKLKNVVLLHNVTLPTR